MKYPFLPDRKTGKFDPDRVNPESSTEQMGEALVEEAQLLGVAVVEQSGPT
jgi:hypothetical protein